MKRKSDKVLFCLNTGIFPANIMFSCGFSFDEIITELKKMNAIDWLSGIEYDKQLIDNGDYFCLSREIVKPNGKSIFLYYIVITSRFTFTDFEFVKLAHEILHFCQFFNRECFDRNVEHECEAYLHSHIMKQCIDILRGKNEN